MFIVIYSMHYLCMYLSVCLAHSSTQTVFKSWRFHGPLLWTLIFSYFHRFSIGFKSGDWLGHSSSFTFFLWNQLRVSLDVCLGSLSRWNVHPHFIFIILVDGSRFYQEYLGTFFHSSFLQLYEFLPVLYHDVFGVMCSVIWPPNMVCIMASKSTIFVSSDQTIFSQYFTGLSKCCAVNFKCNFFSNRACVVSVHTGHGGWVHYVLFSLKQLYMLIPGLSVHSSVRNLARSTWSWLVYGEMMFFPLPDYGPNSAHWNIQKYRNL